MPLPLWLCRPLGSPESRGDFSLEGILPALVTVATLLDNPLDAPPDPNLDDLTTELLFQAREAAARLTPRQAAPPRTADTEVSERGRKIGCRARPIRPRMLVHAAQQFTGSSLRPQPSRVGEVELVASDLEELSEPFRGGRTERWRANWRAEPLNRSPMRCGPGFPS